jgi:hypothetical protein
MSNTNSNNRQSVWDTFDVTVTGFNDSEPEKSKLIGYASVEIGQLNIEIKSISVYNNNGQLSITLPAIPKGQKPNTIWYKIFEFYDKRDYRIFENKILDGLQAYFREHSMNPADPDSGILLA